jgi:hypothetical protein
VERDVGVVENGGVRAGADNEEGLRRVWRGGESRSSVFSLFARAVASEGVLRVLTAQVVSFGS